MDNVVILAAVAQIVGALFVAAITAGCRRTYPRPHLLPWSRSFLASALGGAFGLLTPFLVSSSEPSLARTASTFVGVFLQYFAIQELILGSWSFQAGRDPDPGMRRRLRVSAAALTIATAAAAVSTGTIFTRVAVRSIPGVLGMAALAWSSATLLRTGEPRGRSGTRIVAGTLGILALHRLHSVVFSLLAMRGGTIYGYGLLLGLVEFAVLGALGVGVVLQLLEDEHERAIRAEAERVRLEREAHRGETLAAMGSLVAGVAHEVRTPLFSLSATVDALELGGGPAEEERELRALLRSQLRRLSNLMQDLLDYGRPPHIQRTAMSVRGPLEAAARDCAPAATQAAVRVELDIAEDLPVLAIDAPRLQQAFQNLVHNAVQHAPQGSAVRLRARAATTPEPGVICVVEDSGPGLPEGEAARVFQPFYSRRKGGTGMGLAVAQRFVEAHGGELTAANGAEGGAVFTVFLPASDERVPS